MTHQNISNLFNPIQIIIIENFHSHARTEVIPAGPGQLTVIVGQSRQGKTAIFRALKWLFYNAPDGADFIRWGCTFARVTAGYADGTQVIRYRTAGGINRYIIRKPSLTTGQKGQFEEQVYEGFGRGAVPLEVQQVTGVSPVEISKGLTLNLNLAEQLDGPFLGNKAVSSTDRAKVLGDLAGTKEVDFAGKELGTDLYRWRQEEKRLNGDQEKHTDGEIQTLQKQIAEYDYLPEFKAKMDKLAGIKDAVKAAMERREKLSELHEEYTLVKFKAINAKLEISRCKELIGKIVPAIETIEKQFWKAGKTNLLKMEWDKNAVYILAAETAIRKTQGLSQAEENLRSTEGQFGRRGQAETIITRWNKAAWDIEQAEKVLANTNKIHAAEKLTNMAQQDVMQLTSLIPIAQQLSSIEASLWKAVWTLNETQGVPQAESSLAELYSSMDRKSKLAMLCGKWDQSKEDMAVVERQIERTKGIGKAEKLVSVIDKDMVRIKWLDNFTWNLDTYKKQITTESILAQDAEADINKYQDKYYETLKQAGKCPTCGGEIDQKNLKEII